MNSLVHVELKAHQINDRRQQRTKIAHHAYGDFSQRKRRTKRTPLGDRYSMTTSATSLFKLAVIAHFINVEIRLITATGLGPVDVSHGQPEESACHGHHTLVIPLQLVIAERHCAVVL